MKIVKIVVGVVATILALLKLLSISLVLTTGDYSRVPQPVGSWLAGSVAGLVIFSALAVFCFRPKKP